MLARPACLTAALAAAAVSLAVAAPAHADSETIKDAKNDVAGPAPRAAARASDAFLDIRTAKADYAKKKLTVSTTLGKLDLKKDFYVYWSFLTDSMSGSIEFARVDGQSFANLYSVPTGPSASTAAGCETPDLAVDQQTSTVTMTVPAKCLDNADAIQLGAGASVPPGDRNDRGDDARTNGVYYGPGFATLGAPLARG